MSKNILSFLVLSGLAVINAAALNYDSLAMSYISRYKKIAVEEMERAKVPASITLAQGLLETGFGQSELMKNTNNHFGIKCHTTWTGKTYKYHDDAPNECFRVYDNPDESYRDHSDFLRHRTRYAKLFTFDIKDYKAWAYGLKEAGYATNPKYPELLIKYIETYQLYKYDEEGYLEDEWFAEQNIEIQEEIFIDNAPVKPVQPAPSPQVVFEEPEKINTNVSLPTQPSMVKTGPKKIYKVNKLKAVKMAANEDLAVISLKVDIDEAELMAFNDITNGQVIAVGQYVYLQPKKLKSKEKTYKVKSTDNMWLISQNKGVKLEKLLWRNQLTPGEEPEKGETVYLKGKADKKPKLRKIEKPVQAPLLVKNEEKESPKPTQEEKKWNDNQPKTPGPVNDAVVLFDLEETEALASMQSSPKSTTPQQTTTVAGTRHKVVKGDTMYNISKRYGVTMEEIRKWNNMADNNVQLGQVLLINP